MFAARGIMWNILEANGNVIKQVKAGDFLAWRWLKRHGNQMFFVDPDCIFEQKVEVKDTGALYEMWTWATAYRFESMLNSFNVMMVLQLDDSTFVLRRYILTYLGK